MSGRLMTANKRNLIVAIGVATCLLVAASAVVAVWLAGRLEPYAREAAIRYLSQRFDADVQLQTLHFRLPQTSLIRLVFTRGREGSAQIVGENLSLRLKKQRDAAPLFVIQKFSGEVNLESLLHPPVVVSQLFVDGMEIQVPPRNERPRGLSSAGTASPALQAAAEPRVMIEKLKIQNAILVLQPRNPQRFPLVFDIESVQLASGGAGASMPYEASLTISKPPGHITTRGTFGPWRADDLASTPIAGDYLFEKADLGVFAGIAGILSSNGRFEGQLSSLKVQGQASVPNFRLGMAGNPVPLFTRFSALVDGTNGNTMLQPVAAVLGSTNFTTSGDIIQHQTNQPRAISLKVAMPNGDLRDVLRLAMKGTPFMEGRLVLNTRIDIPPLTAKVREKLELDGRFEVLQGKFLHSRIQNQIDSLSKRAQGQPQKPDTDEVVSQMKGEFHMENARIRFRKLSFGVPGADLDLTGDYNLDTDALDFGGALRLQATVSQMVTGWKSVILRPVDRLFERGGVGTYLPIRIDGTSKAPRFGVVLVGREVGATQPKR
jgi:hypothetical protein